MVLVQTTLEGARLEVQHLKREIEAAKVSMTELNNMFTTYLALCRRFGLPPNIMEFFTLVQQARMAMTGLTRSIQLFYAATGPLGWAIALGGLAISGIMLADVTASSIEYGRRGREW